MDVSPFDFWTMDVSQRRSLKRICTIVLTIL